MDDWASQLAILGDVALAMLFGGVVGIERERAHKPAGFRTHMLVAGGAALYVALGHLLVFGFRDTPGGGLRSDPIRMIEAVVTGISFLGAGTIFRSRSEDGVAGLTTAASLLLSSAIGIAVAIHHRLLALGVTLLTLAVLWGLGRVERWIERSGRRGR